MSKRSIVLVRNMPAGVGEPVRLIATSPRNLVTISITTSNFRGKIYLDGSFAASPQSEADWFPVVLTDQPFIEFPLNDRRTGTFGYTVRGLFTWVRARIEQDSMYAPQGFVDRILLSS